MTQWLSFFALCFMLSCSDTEPPGVTTAAVTPPDGKVVLTVYSGRGESLVGPLFERVPADAPFTVQVQYGKTAEMVTRLIAEGDQSPADVIFAQDSGHLGVLTARDVLAPLPSTILSQVNSRFSDPDGKWVGTSGRLRVLVYNSEKLNHETLPKSLEDLADPKWKGRLGWAPTNGSLHAHLSALRHAWGEDKTREWLQAVVANAPTRYPKNSPQVAAANEGAIDIGWVNHYYLHRLDKEGRTAQNWSFPSDGDVGNMLMVSGVGIRKGSKNVKAAHAFIEWLLSEGVQTYFAQEGFEYPTRPGIETHADVPSLGTNQLADVNQAHLADLGPTRTMLTELGLL
jgi:iron(III) transport system substrate-binding protein